MTRIQALQESTVSILGILPEPKYIETYTSASDRMWTLFYNPFRLQYPLNQIGFANEEPLIR